jgi:AraC-like DNA-binding protein
MNRSQVSRLRWCHREEKTVLLAHGASDLLTLAQRRGGQLHQLLAGTRIFEADLQKPLGRHSAAEWRQLISNCQQLASPELAGLLGVALLHNKYIAVSQAVLHARDLQQALKVLSVYRHQLCPLWFVQLAQRHNQLVLRLLPACPLDKTACFLLQSILSYLLSLLKLQWGECSDLRLQISPQLTNHIAAFLPTLPCQLSEGLTADTDGAAVSIFIPQARLPQPFRNANARAYHDAKRTCRQLQKTLQQSPTLHEALFRLQQRQLPASLTLEQASTALGISSSTLRRLLAQEDTSLSRISDLVRQQQAFRLLSNSAASNRQLAQQLGYSDEHNFRRAFKRWTGLLPSDFRAWLLGTSEQSL